MFGILVACLRSRDAPVALDWSRIANFHDLVKARLLSIGTPVQIVRRSTFDESVAPPTGSSRQDEATRAWKLHVALYYKAGGCHGGCRATAAI